MIIASNKEYCLQSPYNEWDINYHLLDMNGVEYLIDIEDVGENKEEQEKYDLSLCFDDLKELRINSLIEYSWKINNMR